MTPDRELLERYTRDHSESAFTELVERHINVVYSAALRESRGDTAQAADITQAVFTELARKAGKLSQHTSFAGWLYTCVRHVAANTRRSEFRRQRREQEAHQMKELHSADSAEVWRQLQPVLDDAMHDLNDEDRAAVVLRFFENRSHREVGLALGLEENAARMRTERALEKLKGVLARRGITSTAAGLSAALVFGGIASAPSGLAATVATGAVASAMTGGATLTILKIMSLSKIQTGLAAAIIAGSVATSLVVQHNADAKLHSTDATLAQQAEQIAALQNRAEVPVAPTATLSDPRDELSRLRAEATALRSQTNEIARLRDENQRLRGSRAPSQPTPSLQEQAEARAESFRRMSYTKQLALGVIQTAMDNQDQVPTNFDAVMKNRGTAAMISGLMSATNFALEDYEIVYHGPLTQREMDNSRQILVREKQARKMPDGTWQRVYVHLDGSGIVHSEPDGNFDAYEAQGGIKPTAR